MFYENKIWFANTEDGSRIGMLPQMANRHGLVAGATGTGKTVTLKILAETFSEMGVPVFMADVKGDIAGMMKAGEDSEDMQKRIERFGLADKNFKYQGYPVTFWDIYGENGIPLRTTLLPHRQISLRGSTSSAMPTSCMRSSTPSRPRPSALSPICPCRDRDMV